MIHIFIPKQLEPYVMPICFAVLFILGGHFQADMWRDHERYQRLLDHGESATAEIVDMGFRCIENDCRYYHVSYDYTVEGRAYHTKNEHISDHDTGDPLYEYGDQVEIIYLPSEPSFSYIADNLTYPRDKASDFGMVPMAALWGLMLGFFWKPFRDYTYASWRGNIFFHFRYTVTYIAILVFIQLLALAAEKGEPLAPIHFLWFIPTVLLFGVPWIEIRRSSIPRDAKELWREGYHGGSLQRIILEIAFPLFLVIFAVGLTFWRDLRENNTYLTLYLVGGSIIGMMMIRVWAWYIPLFNEIGNFVKWLKTYVTIMIFRKQL